MFLRSFVRMKYLPLNLSRLPCYFTSEPSRWSYQTIMDNVIRRTRAFLRFFDRGKAEFKAPTQKICIRGSTSVKRPYFSYFRSNFLHRATSKWNSNSLAAALSRGTSKALFRGGCGPVFGFMGFALAKKPSLLTEQEELEGLAFEIREAFSKLPGNLNYSRNRGVGKVPDMHKVSVNDLEFGDLLAKGCNAAVYSARWKYRDSLIQQEQKQDTEEEMIVSHSEIEISNSSNINLNCRQNSLDLLPMTKELSQYGLAVKLMFNYSAKSDAFTIFRAMYKEMLPAYRNFSFCNNSLSLKPGSQIPPHPNIVEMYTAFTDEMPLLTKAVSSYPQALPARLIKDGCGRNMTMFLVMKRYHCNLKDYLKNYQPSIQTSLLLLCQLLEGLVHLLQNRIAHRDLKTDNILIDLSDGLSTPLLTITDFGNCLEDLQLPYPTEEMDRGGNIALMAPEVATAEAGPFSYIDYSRSDIWTLGTIAYEIFGAGNPFYAADRSNLQSATYREEELPKLPKDVPVVVRKLIADMLRRDPKMRPSPSFAATVCQLLLHAPTDLFDQPPSKQNYQKIAKWLFLTSAETFLQTGAEKSSSLSVQLQLRLTLCRRIFFSELLKALQYITQAS